jgi:hypothetical protein
MTDRALFICTAQLCRVALFIALWVMQNERASDAMNEEMNRNAHWLKKQLAEVE